MARLLAALLLTSATAFRGPATLPKHATARTLAEQTEGWEPPEFEENRVKARKRQERFSPLDKEGAARKLLLDAQREIKARQTARPAYLPLKPEASLSNATTGQWFSGVVRNLKPHGAWVSIGSEVDGFVHCRDMSDKEFVGESREVLRLGEDIEVCIKGADAEKRVLSLSLLPIEPVDKSRRPVNSYAVDELLEDVVVSRVTKHAGFVDVGCQVPAYLHVGDIGLLPRRKVGAARIPRLKLEAPGQTIPSCWVKAVDVGRDRLRLTLVPPGPERDDPTLFGRRTSPMDEEDEAPPAWTD